MTQVRRGDRAAYGVLYERHLPAARKQARQLSRCAADADDLISDTFARLLTMLLAGGGPDASFRAYLLTSMRRLAYDRTRRDRKLQLVADVTNSSEVDAEKTSVPWVDTVTIMVNSVMAAKAFARLPDRWQAVLWWTVVEEVTPADVAPMLDLKPNGVSALAYRAREGLRYTWLQAHLADVADDSPCHSTAGKLGAWTRGATNQRETAQIYRHLAQCPQCRHRAAELTEVNAELRTAPTRRCRAA